MAKCLCGCGNDTKLSTITNVRYGWVKGTPNKYLKGHNRPLLGKKRPSLSDEDKAKQREAHLGKKYNMTEAGRAALRENIKKATTPELRMENGVKRRGKKLSKEHVRNAMRRRPITSLELAFQKIVDDHELPYKFVGNGAFIIDGLNPDFININGEKIAIEVYARFYKTLDGYSVEKYKSDRISRLSPFGWKLYFFDETQVKPEIVLQALGGGEN